MHTKDWYLFLNEQKDAIEFMLNEELDITGWDLRKSLLLLKKSNAALIERFQSPVVYYSVNNFGDHFKKLIAEYYSPAAVFYHHYSLAKKFWGDIQDQQKFRLKNYFYLIRSMLSCNWIIESDAVLPMHIEGLMELIDDERKTELRKLIEIKSTVNEKYLYTKDESLNTWILALWNKIEGAKDKLGAISSSYTLLNEFFIKTINEDADNRMD